MCLGVIGRPAESCTCAAILQGLDPAKDELGSADWHALGSRHPNTSAAAYRLSCFPRLESAVTPFAN